MKYSTSFFCVFNTKTNSFINYRGEFSKLTEDEKIKSLEKSKQIVRWLRWRSSGFAAYRLYLKDIEIQEHIFDVDVDKQSAKFRMNKWYPIFKGRLRFLKERCYNTKEEYTISSKCSYSYYSSKAVRAYVSLPSDTLPQEAKPYNVLSMCIYKKNERPFAEISLLPLRNMPPQMSLLIDLNTFEVSARNKIVPFNEL